MRVKRFVALCVAALLVAALAVAGCGGGDDDDDGAASGGPSKNVTITFWNGFTSSDRPAVEELVKRFNASQSKVKVDMTIQPWDTLSQKLLPAYAAGEGPTLVALDTQQLPGYVSKGVFQPVDALYESEDFPTDQLIPTAREATQWDGKQYAAPMSFASAMLYWNKKLFREAGIDGPPKTWDEWADAAVKLTKQGGGSNPSQYGVLLPDHESIPVWPMLLWGNGGGVASEDGKTATFGDQASIEAMDFWANLIREQKVSPVGTGGADADKLFQAQKGAMLPNGPWASAGFAQAGVDFGIAPMPAGPAEQTSVGISVAMFLDAKADSDETAAAYEFMKFWNSVESQTYWSVQTAYPPTRTDIPESALKENPTALAFSQHSSESRLYLPGTPRFPEINDNIVFPTVQRILSGRGTPSELMPEAAKQIQPLLGG